jgi:hypothetical protein
MRGAPHSGFARLISPMSVRSSAETFGLPTGFRSPAPIRPKANPMPADDRFRSDDRNRAQDGREPVIEPNEQQTIAIVQSWSLQQSPEEHVDLLSQGEIFRLYRRSRHKERCQEAKNQLEQVGHQVASSFVPRVDAESNFRYTQHYRPHLLVVDLGTPGNGPVGGDWSTCWANVLGFELGDCAQQRLGTTPSRAIERRRLLRVKRT